MTRLLVLTEVFYPSTSGGAHVRWQFSKLAAERGHDITVFTPRVADTPAAEQVEGVEIRRPLTKHREWLPAHASLALVVRVLYAAVLAVYLLWWIREREVDGVHSASHSMHWVGTLLAAVHGVPLVTFVGYSPSVTPSPGRSPKALLERVNFRLFIGEVALCRTPRVKEEIEKRSDARVEILHGALTPATIREAAANADPTSTRKRYRITDDERFLLYVGRFVPIKNVGGTIDLLAALPERYKLVIVGDGPEAETVAGRFDSRGLTNRVVLPGKLPHDRTLQTIAAADALVLTSKAEAYPTVVFEALSLGIDVFAPPVGILTEFEHPGLHVAPLGALPDRIRAADLTPNRAVDETMLDEYSMERYTDDILAAVMAAG